MLTFQHSGSTLSFDENRRMCVTLYGRKVDGKSVKVVVRNLTAYGSVSGNVSPEFQAHLNRLLQWYLSMNLTERSAKKFKREEGYEKPDEEIFRSWDTYWWHQCEIGSQLQWTQTKGHNIRNVKDGPGPIVHKFATQKNDIWRAALSILKDLKGTHEKIQKFRQKMYIFANGKSVRSVPKLVNIPLQLYETMFNPEIVWMVDHQLPACSWMTLTSCSVMDESFGDNWYKNVGYCSLNVTCDHNQVIPCESPPAALAPFRVLSYDIEATPYLNPDTGECDFPDPKRDEIITIGVCAFDMVSNEMVQTVFMLEYKDQPRCTSLSPLPSPTDEYDPSITTVFSFTDELQMLEAFAAHIKEYDPEIITGYNVLNFDNVYLIRRIQALCGCGEDNPYCTSCSGARTFSRVNRQSVLKKKYTHSKQRGGQESWEAWIEGRDWMDIYRVVIADHKLRSYKLDNVCLELLGTQKMPIAYDDIPKHQTTPEGREFLAQYCVKDAWLPCQIIVKRCKVINAIQMAQVTGVLLTTILHRGQQIRTMLLMLKQIKERCRLHAGHPRWFLPDESNSKRPTADGFEGAVVITPKPGYYQTPVVTLDFASLYPSIMRAYNMCFSTLIPSYTEAQKQGLKWSEETQMIKDPSDPNYPEMRPIRSFEYPEGGKFKYVLKKTDVCFHTSTKRYGILPEILHQLLNERSRVKKLRKKYGEKSMDYAVLDGRQLALKVCANSVYGFTGAGMGYLGEKRIASSVTRVGRGMANHTKAMCEEKYKEHGLEIVYGDTVSLFNASLFFVSFSDLSFRTRVGLCLCEHTSFHVRYELFAGINYKGGQDWH
jgi:DNA polymerase delta subunit 1